MTRIALPTVIDLNATSTLAEALRAASGPVTLDGAAVERIGVCGLQLLLSAAATADATGEKLTIEQPSAALFAAARTAGAGILLGASPVEGQF